MYFSYDFSLTVPPLESSILWQTNVEHTFKKKGIYFVNVKKRTIIVKPGYLGKTNSSFGVTKYKLVKLSTLYDKNNFDHCFLYESEVTIGIIFTSENTQLPQTTSEMIKTIRLHILDNLFANGISAI